MKTLTFKQGIHPEYNKDLTEDSSLEKAARPQRVMIPLQQHIGAPCRPLVAKGDHVKLGQKIGDSDSFISAPVHASLSGVVEDIREINTPAGGTSLAVIIKADEEDEVDKSLNTVNDISKLTAKEITEIVREAGIVGMGGAMFPTHVKISVPEDKNVEYFILNGAECEPYLTVDHRMMLERPKDVLFGMKALMKAADVEKGFIAIEKNKPDAILSMKGVLAEEENIEVKVFATKYPQGGEKMLIKAALNREVPVGGLPLDVGVIVNNITTAAAVSDALQKGMPLVERSVTITGKGINNPRNLIAPIGTPIQDLIEQAGGLKEDAGKIILGGPMTGCAQADTSVPVVKGTSGILVQLREEVIEYDPRPCIKCARCVDSCPQNLMPVQLSDFAEHDLLDQLEEYNVLNCIECGCCSYVCPSNRPLLHNIKLGKAAVTARRREEKNE